MMLKIGSNILSDYRKIVSVHHFNKKLLNEIFVLIRCRSVLKFNCEEKNWDIEAAILFESLNYDRNHEFRYYLIMFLHCK